MLYLKEKGKYSFYLSFFIVNLFWLPLFYRTYERVAFINKYGNFEGDDARGSPLAFVLGLYIEQFFFIPLTVLFILGLIIILRGKVR